MRRTRNKDGIRTFSGDEDLVESRRSDIADQALILFNRRGYTRTTMQDLADDIKMSIGGIYHYFGSKQDILTLIINKFLARANSRREDIETLLAAASATDILKQFIIRFYKDTEKHHESSQFFYIEFLSFSPEAQQTILDITTRDMETCAAILSKGVQNKEFKIADVRVMSNSVIVLAHMWVLRRWYLHDICSMDEYIKIQTDLILHGIST